MKGQLSAEMLILIVVILAVAAIVANQLITGAKNTSDTVDSQSQAVLDKTTEAMKGKSGDFCTKDEQCLDGCDTTAHKCN